MTIRSVDLQMLIPNAVEVGKTQHRTDQQNTAQQQQFAEQWQKISADRQKQVQATPKSEGGKVRSEKDGRQQSAQGEGSMDSKDKKETTHPEEGAPAAQDPVRGHHVDIKT